MSNKNVYYWNFFWDGSSRRTITIYVDGSIKIGKLFLDKLIEVNTMNNEKIALIIDILLHKNLLTKREIKGFFPDFV